MTVFPEEPRLGNPIIHDGKEYRRLEEDHLTYVHFRLGWSLEVYIHAGYYTDGASVPKNIFANINDRKKIEEVVGDHIECGDFDSLYTLLVGMPWDMPRLLAAVVHDALYSLKWAIRLLCDKVYKNILKQTNYSAIRRDIEYDLIRIFGWSSWKSVGKKEQANARKVVSVHWVRTKNIPKRMTMLGVKKGDM